MTDKDEDSTDAPIPWSDQHVPPALVRQLRDIAAGFALVMFANPQDEKSQNMLDILDALANAHDTDDPWLGGVAVKARTFLDTKASRKPFIEEKRDLRRFFESPAGGPLSPVGEARARLVARGMDEHDPEQLAVVRQLAEDFVLRLDTSKLRRLVPGALSDFDWRPDEGAVSSVEQALLRAFQATDAARRDPENLVVKCLQALGAPARGFFEFEKRHP